MLSTSSVWARSQITCAEKWRGKKILRRIVCGKKVSLV